MIGIDNIIVAMWFLPVIWFIVLPLVVSCFILVYSLFAASNPAVGQQRQAIISKTTAST